MSSKSSDSDQCSFSDDSEFNYIPGNYSVIESEIMEASDGENGADDGVKTHNGEPYSCEPMADQQWVAEYRQRQAKKEQRLASLNDRLAGREELSTW